MTTAGLPRTVVHADGQHGVAAYARQLSAAVDRRSNTHSIVPLTELAELPTGTRLHLHFTDRLWGASPDEAAEAIRRLAQRHPLSVTLHDLPQRSDGERNLRRRSVSYRAVVRATRLIICNSAHEAALLREFTDPDAMPTVIPLPVDRHAHAGTSPTDGTVGVLGFFYPGKGHDETLAAMTDAGATTMVLLGRASPGHEHDLAQFVRRAESVGVSVQVSGYVDDDELVRRSQQVGVPVLAHRHVSASGSLGSWIAAGRRPIATINRYTREMAALRPGTLTLVEVDDLAVAMARAQADQSSTWLSPEQVIPFGQDAVADAYLVAWAATSW